MEKIRAWHFCAKNDNGVPVLGYDAKHLEVAPGYVYSIGEKQKPSLCECGMHASRRALDALLYSPGEVACLVDVWGDVVESNDKLVGRHREVIAMVDAEMILHRFACWCVRRIWDKLTDERSRRAVEVKEAWIEERATDEELHAARAAARAAALDAAWAGALDAAWGAWAAHHAARATQNAQLERMLLEAMGRSSMND